jgi:ankyrin repeat protein
MSTASRSLIHAASYDKLQEVCDLLKERANINATHEFGQTALMLAIQAGHTNIAVELLNHDKLDFNHQDEQGDTALMLAIKAGHAYIVIELLKDNELDVIH